MFKYLYNTTKPTLPKNASYMIDLFSGGGGVKTGAIMAGLIPIGVEKDPDNAELSQVFTNWHDVNFKEYGSRTITKTVQEMYLNGWQEMPRKALWGHASPVCTRFSGYSSLNKEQEDLKDITSAKAVGNAIATLGCKYWSIEQVPDYIDSESFKIIVSALRNNRYSFTIEPKIDFYEYGVIPQSRKRFFLLAWKHNANPLEFPPKLKTWGWFKTLQNLSLVPANILNWQEKAIASITKPYTALAIQRTGMFNGVPKIRTTTEPMWTITKHSFHDHKKNSRLDPFNFYIPSQGLANPHPRAIARMCGFPDWFRFSPKPYHYGSIFGYAVPPTWMYNVISHNLSHPTTKML